MAYRTAPEDTDTLPSGLPYIIGNEAAERFSFYGMKAILTVFMVQYLMTSSGVPVGMSEPEAKEVFHLFVAATYITPILGAILADGFFGKYPVIIGLSLFYCLGHGVLALTDFPGVMEPQTSLYLGLGLIAVGAGGIKPCVSAHVGDQFGPRNVSMLEKVYGWFYVSINVGAFISQLMIPWVLKNHGPGWAFGIPGAVMALALFVFWLGRHRYAHLPAGGADTLAQMKSPEGRGVILRLLPLYVFVIAFWMIFDQTGGAWVLQAREMNLEVGPLTVLPSQVQAINPFYILLFVPLLSMVVFPAVNRVVELTPLRKIGAGMLLTVVPFLITGWVETRITAGESPSILWHVLAYAVLTLAEVLVSITVLEFSYTQAPKSWKSLIMGIYFLSVGSANLLVAQVNHYIEAKREAGEAVLAGADYYWFFAGVMAAAAVAFVLWSLTYKYREGLDGIGPGEAGRTVPLDGGRDGMAVVDEG